MNKKRILGAALASAVLIAPFVATTTAAAADTFYTNQTNAQRADITNWVANSSEQIGNNISSQHIDVNNLNGARYIIQWGDTLSGISAATGISVSKLAYDNKITNIDLIYAGDVLILNRDGVVPSNWTYDGDGNQVANTKVTINDFSDNSDHSVHIDVSPVIIENNNNNNNNDNQESNDSNNSSQDDNQFEASSSDDQSSTDSSESDTQSSSDDSTSAEDKFSDAVSDKFATKIGLADEDKDNVSVDFTSDSDNQDADSESDSDSESNDADSSDTSMVYDEDQTVTLSSSKLTKSNANKLVKKIYKQLKKDHNLSDVKDADEIEITITQNGKDFDFNIQLTSNSDADSSSDETSSDEDSSDNDSTDSESSQSSQSDEATDTTDDTDY